MTHHHDQFRNLSSAPEGVSADVQITPQNPLGEEIWGVKISTLPPNCPKLGGPQTKILYNPKGLGEGYVLLKFCKNLAAKF